MTTKPPVSSPTNTPQTVAAKTPAASLPLWSTGMRAVISAQFLSAFADNALLFATLALLIQHQYPDWSQPVMQMMFIIAYIICAPFVGQIADSFSKGRVMLIANSLKLLGALCICTGLNPFAGYTLAGVGAAAYSPAKYGILGELTSGEHLVKANGLMESSTIAAILLGSICGGFLADKNILLALILCALSYAGAVIINLRIPKLPAARPASHWRPAALIGEFYRDTHCLWQNPAARFSLCATSLFWGAGITLRFLLILWVPLALGIQGTTMPPLLNGVVAIGIIIGAAAAGRLITLHHIQRCMPAGILIGVSVALFSLQHSLPPVYLLLILTGVFGGFFVVPLNALLQQQGKQLTGTGKAIAVQNLAENAAMLLMLALYSLAVKIAIPIVAIGIAFGTLFALAIASLWWYHWQSQRKSRHSG